MSIDLDKNGNLLFGTNSGGINLLNSDGQFSYYNTENGLISDVIFNIYVDEENTYWVASRGGLSMIKDGEIFNFIGEQGLPNESPFDVLEDQFGFPTY